MLRHISPYLQTMRFFSNTTVKQSHQQSHWTNFFIGGIGDMGGTFYLPYCYQPEQAFVLMLEHYKIALTRDKIRGPMGTSKPLHVKILWDMPEVKAQLACLLNPPTAEEAYQCYLRIQDELIENEAQIIPYSKECLQLFKENRMPFCFTTGFDSKTTEKLLAKTKQQLLHDYPVISADQVSDRSRPSMVKDALWKMGIPLTDVSNVFFITDAKADVSSVRKVFSTICIIAVIDYGTSMGIDDPKLVTRMSQEELRRRRDMASLMLSDAGADITIPNLGHMPYALAQLTQNRLQSQMGSLKKGY